jgi:hypothetical protein
MPACTTPRYVGEITRNGALVHRAFGVVLDYPGSDWRAIDPANPSSPPDRTPIYVQTPLDLDADGVLEDDEVSPRYEPLFTLQSTSVKEAWASLDVLILPADAEERSAKTFLRARFRRTRTKAASTPGLRTPMLTQEGELPNGLQAIYSVAEQPAFEAEEGVERRQLVFIWTTAPDIDDRLRARHLRLLEGLSLANEAAPVRPGESYRVSGSSSGSQR